MTDKSDHVHISLCYMVPPSLPPSLPPRSFDLVLVPDHSVFHKDARVRTSSGPVEDLDLHTATYTGYDRSE